MLISESRSSDALNTAVSAVRLFTRLFLEAHSVFGRMILGR